MGDSATPTQQKTLEALKRQYDRNETLAVAHAVTAVGVGGSAGIVAIGGSLYVAYKGAQGGYQLIKYLLTDNNNNVIVHTEKGEFIHFKKP